MKCIYFIILFPALLLAQEFEFQQEFDTIPVEIEDWEPFVPWMAGLSYAKPAFSDIDLDSDYDLLVGTYDGSLHILQNEGSANIPDFLLLNSEIFPLDSLDAKVCLDFCDLDNDDDEDLLYSDDRGVVKFFENFSSPSQIHFELSGDSLNGTIWANRLTSIDIDGDEDYDLFSGNYDGRINFFLNEGNPEVYNFTFVTDYFLGIDVGYMANPKYCDIDFDGDYDLFIGNSSGTIRYYKNIGDSATWNFEDPVMNWLEIDVGEHASPEFCDIDGDGDYDLFVGREPYLGNQTQGDIFFYENIGNATNPEFQFVTTNYLTLDVGGHDFIQLVDLDADSDLDIFVGVGHFLRYFENIGISQSPSFTLQDTIYQNIDLLDIIPYFCDIDADNDYDLFAGTSAIPGPPGLHFYENQGTPEEPNLILTSVDLVPADYWVIINPVLADINSDGDFDLFVTDHGDNDIYFFENIGTPLRPIFAEAVTNWQGIGITISIMRTLRFFDIDNDGDLDLFFNNNWQEPGGENLRFYRNDGTPQEPSMTLVTTDYLPFEVITPCAWFYDIDSDNYTDLFVGDSYGGILFFHGIDDSSGYVPPYFPPCPYPCIKINFGPNPANPTTWVTFNLPYPQKATLAVYNLLGQKVTTLAQGLQPPGSQTYFWNASDFSSGTYLIRLETDVTEAVQRILVVK